MKYFLLFVFLLSACQTPPPVRQRTDLDVKQFWSEQEKRTKAFESYAAKMDLRYQGKEESVSGKGKVFVSPEGLRMELQDPLGRLHYVLLSKKNQVTACYPREHIAYQDVKNGKKYFERFLGFELSVEELRLFWLGILGLSAKLSPFQWEESSGVFTSRFSLNGNHYALEIDPQTGAILKLSVQKNGSEFEVSYREFEKVRNISLAHEVQLEAKQLGTKIEVEWDRISAFPTTSAAHFFEWEEDRKVKKYILK